MVFLNPKPDALKQSQIDQFTTFVRSAYEQATGQPFNRRAKEAIAVLARVLADSGKGAYQLEGPDVAVRWMIGACDILTDEWLPKATDAEG